MPKQKTPDITVTPRSDEANWSQDEIIRKRLEGDPFGRKASNDVPMVDRAHWNQHWFNSLNDPGRLYDVRHNKGWVPLTQDRLPEGITVESLGYRVREDGAICRGDRNTEEVCFVMPKDLHTQVELRKADANTRGLRSERAAKEDAGAAVAAKLGDQAGEYIAKHAHITIRDTVTQG